MSHFFCAGITANLLLLSACAPVSPSIDRNRYNAARNQPAASPDSGANKTQNTKNGKSLTIHSEITTQVVAAEDFAKLLKSQHAPNKSRADGTGPMIPTPLKSDDNRLQKFVNESVMIKSGNVVAKKVVVVIGVKNPDKLLRSVKAQAWSLTKGKGMGTLWSVSLDADSSAELKKSLAQEITQMALVITPFTERELIELTDAQAE